MVQQTKALHQTNTPHKAMNLMIEMLFGRLKHPYLFTISLPNIDALAHVVDFYLTESNTCMPLIAPDLVGATLLNGIVQIEHHVARHISLLVSIKA